MTSHISAAERWERALCSGMSPEDIERVFFRGTGRPPKNPEFRKICNHCPIQNFCGEYGIVHEEAGVWGGQTQAERERISPMIRPHLIDKAKSEGWYEVRKSIDQIIAEILPPSTQRSPSNTDVQTPQSAPALTKSPESRTGSFSFDFETVEPASSGFVFDFETAS